MPKLPDSASEKPFDERLKKRLQGRPEVAVNFALTWDVRITTREGSPAIFSSPQDKAKMQEIRASGDALMVGRNTLEADRMTMGVSIKALRERRLAEGKPASPLRVVVSGSGRFCRSSLEAPLFASDFAPILIFSSEAMPKETRVALLERGVILYLSPEQEFPSLRWVLETLQSQHGVQRVVCEGGAKLFHGLLAEDLIDELNLTFCPLLFGGEGAPSLTGLPGPFLAAARGFRLEAMEVLGDECFARYRA